MTKLERVFTVFSISSLDHNSNVLFYLPIFCSYFAPPSIAEFHFLGSGESEYDGAQPTTQTNKQKVTHLCL